MVIIREIVKESKEEHTCAKYVSHAVAIPKTTELPKMLINCGTCHWRYKISKLARRILTELASATAFKEVLSKCPANMVVTGFNKT
jgi:hypothetical protein